RYDGTTHDDTNDPLRHPQPEDHPRPPDNVTVPVIGELALEVALEFAGGGERVEQWTGQVTSAAGR
ncbi:hypothetical protein ACGFYU_37185, partial [Streptomyces sp. NPDC048337]|uniref:hypothetical protein n=1 Tax=Streptomyces sp. NPDC048337 TaxID=3365535 RepID=UPI003713995A